MTPYECIHDSAIDKIDRPTGLYSTCDNTWLVPGRRRAPYWTLTGCAAVSILCLPAMMSILWSAADWQPALRLRQQPTLQPSTSRTIAVHTRQWFLAAVVLFLAPLIVFVPAALYCSDAVTPIQQKSWVYTLLLSYVYAITAIYLFGMLATLLCSPPLPLTQTPSCALLRINPVSRAPAHETLASSSAPLPHFPPRPDSIQEARKTRTIYDLCTGNRCL